MRPAIETKPESYGAVEAYFAEQWRKRRMVGTHIDTAVAFWEWGEKKHWGLVVSWQQAADRFVVSAQERQKTSPKGSGREKCAIELCMLCWCVIDGKNGERKDGEKVAECMCRERAQATADASERLKRVDALLRSWPMWRLSFDDALPNAWAVQQAIAHVRHEVMSNHRDEYEQAVAEWFGLLGETAAAA